TVDELAALHLDLVLEHELEDRGPDEDLVAVLERLVLGDGSVVQEGPVRAAEVVQEVGLRLLHVAYLRVAPRDLLVVEDEIGLHGPAERDAVLGEGDAQPRIAAAQDEERGKLLVEAILLE